jgi:hypothetical protein
MKQSSRSREFGNGKSRKWNTTPVLMLQWKFAITIPVVIWIGAECNAMFKKAILKYSAISIKAILK